jgi:hypothetical protein
MSPKSYSWIVAFIAPASSVLIASIFLYGALFSRFRLAFGLISLGGVFYLLSQLYWLAAQLQGTFGISLLRRVFVCFSRCRLFRFISVSLRH